MNYNITKPAEEPFVIYTEIMEMVGHELVGRIDPSNLGFLGLGQEGRGDLDNQLFVSLIWNVITADYKASGSWPRR